MFFDGVRTRVRCAWPLLSFALFACSSGSSANGSNDNGGGATSYGGNASAYGGNGTAYGGNGVIGTGATSSQDGAGFGGANGGGTTGNAGAGSGNAGASGGSSTSPDGGVVRGTGGASSLTGPVAVDTTPGRWRTALNTTTGRFQFIAPDDSPAVLRGISMTGLETGTRETASGAGFWLFNSGQGQEATNAPTVLQNVTKTLVENWKTMVVRIPICGSAWAQNYAVHD